MASEKSRYLNSYRGPVVPVEFDVLNTKIDKIPQPDLSRIVYQAVQYNDVLLRVIQLHTGFQSAAPDGTEIMKRAIDYALYLDDHVSYKHANSYCQILDEIQVLIKRVADSGQRELAVALIEHTIAKAEDCLECLEDGDFFEMSLGELRLLQTHLASKSSYSNSAT